jgi:RND family efflux transporter MFP subunit
VALPVKRWLVLGVPFLVVISLVGWRVSAEKSNAAKLDTQQKSRSGAAPAVEVAIAESRPILESIEVVGNVQAPHTVRLSPRVAGRIESLDVREGDPVRAGQALVRIAPSELDAQLLQQRAAVSEARSRLAQAEMTAGATDARIESAVRVEKAAVTSAQAEVTREERNFDLEVSAAEAVVTDAESRVASAEAEVRQRRAELTAAQATEKNARSRLARVESLFQKGFVAEQAVDDARERVESEASRVGVAKGQLASSESAVAGAKAQLHSAQKRLAVTKEEGKASIAASKARLEQAKATYDEALANRSQSPAYRENLRALRANVQAAEAGLSELLARIQETVLASPISGIVTERNGDPGSLASPGQAVVVVQSLEWVYVDAPVPVEHASKVFKGQSVKVRLDAFEGREFEGEIEKINPSADLQSRQFNIKVRLENPKKELRPGMFARLDIVTRTLRPTVVVPMTAVQKGPEGSWVMVLDAEDTARRKMVKTGVSDRTGIAVEEGLAVGDRVITLSYSPVREGQKVRIGKPAEGRRP